MGVPVHRPIGWPGQPPAILSKNAAVAGAIEAGTSRIEIERATQIGATTGKDNNVVLSFAPYKYGLMRHGARPEHTIGLKLRLLNRS
jgi:hypothetical protein